MKKNLRYRWLKTKKGRVESMRLFYLFFLNQKKHEILGGLYNHIELRSGDVCGSCGVGDKYFDIVILRQ